ncbi:LTA synthase family protein [Bacillus sp. 7894-2]|uniref:LTA synthase family protein n=1 Tax=Bacillus sp. 7894-2 TaxID=2021695 RepID=UPI000BA6EFF0|nr:LTA synthase family protein [Bacillus sp. 7894-2]PAE25817.1 hypothetical protein CHI10_05920 [Bacillus sp. 7894-2]
MQFKAKRLFNMLIWMITLAAVTLFVMESIHRGGVIQFAEWILQYPLKGSYLYFLLFLLYGVYFVFSKRAVFISSILTICLLGFLAFASFTKERLRGDPLLPADVMMAGEARNMLQFFSDISAGIWIVIITAILLCAAFLVYLFRKIKKEEKKSRYIMIPAISFIILSVLLYADIFAQAFKAQTPNQKENYYENGVLLSFARNIKGIKGEKPKEYTASKISALVRDMEESSPVYPEAGEKPNIIMIMSEAFWDPTVMEQVEFNKDPLPNFHQLQNDYSSGLVHVPVYGGSTANTEFEILTSMSNQFLPSGSVAYKSFIKNPLPALPALLRNQGYKTIAYHTYHNWFYERDTVYKWLGFDHFVSLEFFPQPVQDMMYFRDNEITDEIIKQLNRNDDPNFIFAVTMQNHGPYRTDAKKFYATMEAGLKEGTFTPEAKNILEFYSDNLVEVDKELKRLIDEVEASGEKTIIAFFGDHLPLLGDNYQVYKEAGYFEGDANFEDYVKMYSTPILVWDNLGNREKEQLNLSSPFVGPYILERAGLKGYYLTDYLNQLRKEDKSFLPRMDYAEHSPIDSGDQEGYKLLQYDILFGKREGIEESGLEISPSKAYRLGLGDPAIESAVKGQYKGRSAIVLKGEYFTTSSQVYINGKAVEYTFEDEHTMYAFVPNGVKPKEIQLKIFDSENNKLAESNIYKY